MFLKNLKNKNYYYFTNRKTYGILCSQAAGKAHEAPLLREKRHKERNELAILNTLQETTVHPTADWVYAKLKPRYPNLSLVTVYRNLKKFCETGKAVSVGVINGQEHFDARMEPHAHFVCKCCGAVLDIPQEFFCEEELDQLSAQFHLKVEGAKVLFEGVCPQCEKKSSHGAA